MDERWIVADAATRPNQGGWALRGSNPPPPACKGGSASAARATAEAAALKPEHGPADFGAPCGWLVSVTRADEVGLAHRAGNGERICYDPCAELAVGDVDVVVLAAVGGDGELDGRQCRRVDPAYMRWVDRRPGHQQVSTAGLEQRIVVEAARIARAQWHHGVQFGHRAGIPVEDIVAIHVVLDGGHGGRRHVPQFDFEV